MCQVLQIGQQFGKDKPRQRDVVQAGAQDVLDRAIRAIAGLAELVHVMAVAVLGQTRGPCPVVTALQQSPEEQLVQQRRQLFDGKAGHIRMAAVLGTQVEQVHL